MRQHTGVTRRSTELSVNDVMVGLHNYGVPGEGARRRARDALLTEATLHPPSGVRVARHAGLDATARPVTGSGRDEVQ